MRQYRFSFLLATLLLLLIVSPFVRFLRINAIPILAPIAMMLLFSAVLVSAVFAISGRRTAVVLAVIWATSVIAITAVNAFRPREFHLLLENFLGAGLLVYTLALLLRFLFREQRITFEVIAASLCGYLLLGVLWANVYSMLAYLDPDSFAFPSLVELSVSIEPVNLHFGTERSGTALYFSYVTLTTLGYGDIVPVTAASRMLCTIEAITGQLYLAVLVARLVGLHIAHESRRDPL